MPHNCEAFLFVIYIRLDIFVTQTKSYEKYFINIGHLIDFHIM